MASCLVKRRRPVVPASLGMKRNFVGFFERRKEVKIHELRTEDGLAHIRCRSG